MVAITNSSSQCRLFFVALMLLVTPWLALAYAATTVANPEDAQTFCAEPAHQFSLKLSQAAAGQGLDDELRGEFLKQLEQCRAVYRFHLQQLADEFDDLPAGAYCHSVRREFVESEYLFTVAASRAVQLPLLTDEDRKVAAAFFRRTAPALVRAVNGLFILRHGICMEERIAPFDQPPFESEINRTYPHNQ